MGVPKFYRWISERYPCLSEVVKEYQIPEFDNLYLDMNGIVHVCSHPEDDNPHFRITEEKIFQDIFHYIEVLYRLIKPKKVFFMAIDGVAPRAKMNQQRGRRFRSAKEAESLIRKALEKGETLPSEERFDSNCITPGTPFMVRLQEQLKYFIVKKISTDKLWQGPRIFLSGHETPGEGEHKVMDFIRYEKSLAGYNPNTRHCLYGLDADLIMLGLSSHEPHFALLREEVRFGGKNSQKRSNAPEETTFHLLHLSLFREYLGYEFQCLKSVLPFQYDLERIIDDWIFMGFLVGNDFVPHLPHLHIHHNALPLLWKTYKQVLPTLDGYLHDGGFLDLKRFEKYMEKLAEYDFETFADSFDDLKWLEGKSESKAAKDQANTRKREKASVSSNEIGIPTANEFLVLKNISGDMDDEDDLRAEMGAMTLEEFECIEEEYVAAENASLQEDFRFHKDAYYSNKMNLKSSREMLQNQAEGYVRALQWILHYYFNGVPSWSWFYPFHYAPFLSDVKNFANMKLNFDLGTPFLPFQQLMAVLPAASKNLLPKVLQLLMTSENSPVIDFYPQEFALDLNGKQQEWEAVVCIPFIEERRLLEAMTPLEEKMTPAEKLRNRHSNHILFCYSKEEQGTYTSDMPEAFPDIYHHHAVITEIDKDEFRIPAHKIFKGLCPNSTTEVYFPGFPTLRHLKHEHYVAHVGVKVFQMNSRGENMILKLTVPEVEDIEYVAKQFVGRTVHISWPHLTEAKVFAASDVNEKYYAKEETSRRRSGQSAHKHDVELLRENLDRDASKQWCKEVESLTQRYRDRKGVEIGDTDILLYVAPLIGRKYVNDHNGKVALEKQWSTQHIPVAFQSVVKDLLIHEPEYEEITDLKELYPVGSNVFMLGQPYYSSMGQVISVEQQEGRVRVQFTQNQEPDMEYLYKIRENLETQYFLGYEVAKRVGISSFLVSRITGVLYIKQGSKNNGIATNVKGTNIALNLKFNKSNQIVPGYTKKSPYDGKQWMYSSKVIDLVTQYIEKFPELFDHLASLGDNEDIFDDDVFGEKTSDVKMKELRKWLKSLPTASVSPADIGTEVMNEEFVKNIELVTEKAKYSNRRVKRAKMQVKPHLLYRPMEAQAHLVPDPSTTYELLDRVINVREGYSVPVGLRGTVIGLYPAPKEQDVVYDVLFDEEFFGGLSIRCSPNRGYRLPPSAMINFTHGVRKEAAKTGGSPFKPTAIVKPLLEPRENFIHTRGGDRSNYQHHSNNNQLFKPPHQYSKVHNQLPSTEQLPQWTSNSHHQRTAAMSQQQKQKQQQQKQQQASSGNRGGAYYSLLSKHQSPQNPQHQSGAAASYKPLKQGVSEEVPQYQILQKTPPTPGQQQRNKRGVEGKEENLPLKSASNKDFSEMWNQLQGGHNKPQTWQSSRTHGTPPSLMEAAKALQSTHISNSPIKDSPSKSHNLPSGQYISAPFGQNMQKDFPRKQMFPAGGASPFMFNPVQNVPVVRPLLAAQGPRPLSVPVGLPFDGQVDMSKLFSVPPPPLPNPPKPAATDARGGQVDNAAEGFNRFVAALHSGAGGPEQSKDAKNSVTEGTQALQQMLNVKSSSSNVSLGKNTKQEKYMKQLSVQELFEGASDKEIKLSPAGSLIKNSEVKHEHSQEQDVSPKKRNPVGELLTYCMSAGMSAPHYVYIQANKNKSVQCIVQLSNGEEYGGAYSKDRRQAMDSAAANALNRLRKEYKKDPRILSSPMPSDSTKYSQPHDMSPHVSATNANIALSPFNEETDHSQHRTSHEGNQTIQNTKACGVDSPGFNTNNHGNQKNFEKRRTSESEKKENPFVPMQVFKKQKTPAKPDHPGSDIEKANGNARSVEVDSTNKEASEQVVKPKIKKKIIYDDSSKAQSAASDKQVAAESNVKKQTVKKQVKPPRSRLAAKFN